MKLPRNSGVSIVQRLRQALQSMQQWLQFDLRAEAPALVPVRVRADRDARGQFRRRQGRDD